MPARWPRNRDMLEWRRGVSALQEPVRVDRTMNGGGGHYQPSSRGAVGGEGFGHLAPSLWTQKDDPFPENRSPGGPVVVSY